MKASSQVRSGGQEGNLSLYLSSSSCRALREEKGIHGGWDWGSGHSRHADLWLLNSCIILNKELTKELTGMMSPSFHKMGT